MILINMRKNPSIYSPVYGDKRDEATRGKSKKLKIYFCCNPITYIFKHKDWA